MSKLASIYRRVKKHFHKHSKVLGYIEWVSTDAIYGWAIHKDNLPIEIKCQINKKYSPIQIEWLERKEVASLYRQKNTYCGFKLIFPDYQTKYSLKKALSKNVKIKVFANNTELKNIYKQPKDLKKNLISIEKLSNISQNNKLAVKVESWGGFSLQVKTIYSVKNTEAFSLHCNNQILEPIALWKKNIGDTDFEIEIPGYIWLYLDNDVVNIELKYNNKSVNTAPLLLTTHKALMWTRDILKLSESKEKQYRMLLVLEHFRYSDFVNLLADKEKKLLYKFAEQIGLADFLIKEIKSDNKYLFPHEHDDTLLHWQALDLLNKNLEKSNSSAFDELKNIIHALKLNDKIIENLLFSVTPLLCEHESFLRLPEIASFSLLKRLANADNIWRMSLSLPALMAEGDIARATDVIKQIANKLPGNWLNTECIYFSIKLSRILQNQGKANANQIENIDQAFIELLDAFAGVWFSRLHDNNFIESMIFILSTMQTAGNSHQQNMLMAVERIYGLNPTFWSSAVDKKIPQLQNELSESYAFFQKIYQALTGNKVNINDLFEQVSEGLKHFQRKNNPEAIIFVRDILANNLNELNSLLSTNAKKLLAQLLAMDSSEAIRIAAFPLAEANRLLSQFPQTEPATLSQNVRHLTEVGKSSALTIQQQTSAVLRNLLTAHKQKNKKEIKKVLSAIQKKVELLSKATESGLAFDCLVTAYIIADIHNLKNSHLLQRISVMLTEMVDRTDADWYLPAPVMAGLQRLNHITHQKAELTEFLSETKVLIEKKFVEKVLFLVNSLSATQTECLGWPQDTLVIIYSCRKYLATRVNSIRKTWIQDLRVRQISYLIVVGDGNDTIEDDVLGLNVSDHYEDLPKKTLKLFAWLYQNTSAQYVLKIDDDCFLDVDKFFDSLSYRKHFYYGRVIRRGIGSMDRVWHQSKSHTEHGKNGIDKSPEPSVYADGGGGYTLSRLAILKLLETSQTPAGQKLIACSFMEDKLIGDLLGLSFIEPTNEDYLTYQRRRTFSSAIPVGMTENGFFSSQASPTILTHLDTEHDFEFVQQRCNSRELWPKKIWPTCWAPNIRLNNNQLELLTKLEKTNLLLAEPLSVITVVRNEIIMLPHFLAHYRALGVKSFIVVDNCSDDGSREYLHQQTDVILYSTDTEYKYSYFGVAWQQAILGNHCLGKWALLADADEFFIFENCEQSSLSDFIVQLEAENCNAACTYMIDMYPAGDLSEADFSQHSPFEVACWFDKQPITQVHLNSGWFSQGITCVSNLRHRLTEHAPPHFFNSQKYALIRYMPWVRYAEGLHQASNLIVSKQPTWFAHFKYHAGFKQKVESEIRRGQHFDNAVEYRRYAELLQQNNGSFLQAGISVKYNSSRDFLINF